MKDADVKFTMVTGRIGRILLSQPAKRNALSAVMWQQLIDCLTGAADTPALKVLIITGDGEHFAAGADISEFSTLYATPESSKEISATIAKAMDAIATFPKPTIAKIRGACVGGGCGIALACDMRFADGTSKFGITPGKLGLVYPFSDIKRLIQAVGVSYAKDILFSARLVLAEEAKEIGLVNRLADQYELDQIVRDYALSIADTSGESVSVTKQMFMAFEAGQRGETKSTKDLFHAGFSSDDFQEGYKAFLEKRKPDFP
ncbi:enoyl-CoA hydratase/isomerase family protein [Litorimonas haliclonae]|uniref:enoyl-CoA hydratase/isomerase family protein n=1 Tax=Litorimonas haliclonae TaxID=2081977 RepID=UPI0039EFCA30